MAAVERVRHVLVFRALMLGDWLCATPALRALRRHLPHAHIALCGLEHTAELARRLPTIDEFVAFPGHPCLPEKQPAPGELERFLRAMRARRFDLVLQMHGSGNIVNALVGEFGAAAAAGFTLPGAGHALDLPVPWPEHGSESERCLALTDALGARRDGFDLDFPLFESDRREASRLLEGKVRGRYAVIHAGSQLPSRRWHPERFAAVAQALASRGIPVVLTGSAAEAPLAKAVCKASRQPLIDLSGLTSLWSLGAVIERAQLVVANDTGISHIAAALRTPSVIVASGSDVLRWAPRDQRLHRVHWHPVACRPCAHVECPSGHECAAGVQTPQVIASALRLAGEQPHA